MRETFEVVLEFDHAIGKCADDVIGRLARISGFHVFVSGFLIGAVAQAAAGADGDAARVRHLLDQQDACARIVRLDGGNRSGKTEADDYHVIGLIEA